jgi:AcrR family transcriptional regulator
MQAVAERVGVRAPSLYKRVRDRDALHVRRRRPPPSTRSRHASNASRRRHHRDRRQAYRRFAQEHPEGFRIMFSARLRTTRCERSAAPLIRAATALVGDDDALDAARLFTAWATGFLQMELSGAFRLGGDVDRAFDYGLRRLIAGLTG